MNQTIETYYNQYQLGNSNFSNELKSINNKLKSAIYNQSDHSTQDLLEV